MKLSNEKRNLFATKLFNSCNASQNLEKLKKEFAEVFSKELWASVPKGYENFKSWMKKKNSFIIKDDITYDYFQVDFEEAVFIPINGHLGDCYIYSKYISDYEESFKLATKIFQIKKENKKILDKFTKILYSVNTTNQLFELIPEAKEILGIDEQIKSLVPVELVQEVNKLLKR